MQLIAISKYAIAHLGSLHCYSSVVKSSCARTLSRFIRFTAAIEHVLRSNKSSKPHFLLTLSLEIPFTTFAIFPFVYSAGEGSGPGSVICVDSGRRRNNKQASPAAPPPPPFHRRTKSTSPAHQNAWRPNAPLLRRSLMLAHWLFRH